MNSGHRHRVVVTGMGMVCPLGNDVNTAWSALLAGRCAIARIKGFDPTGFPVTFAAEVDAPPGIADLKHWLTHEAAGQAMQQSGLQGGPGVGVCVGSEAERPSLPELALRLRNGSLPTPEEIERGAPWTPSREVARMLGGADLVSTISTACTSSAQALGEAALHIRRGELHAAVAGGVDVLVDPLMIAGFSLLGALSTRNDEPSRSSRPFDVDRDGFVLGDGAGFMVLESYDSARARGADIFGEILGYGCSLNAYRITDSPPDGRGAALAMEAALKDAELSMHAVDWINAHGTSTPQNDVSESSAVHRLFGSHALDVAVSSNKGGLGHLVAACGVVEVIFSLLAIRDGVIPHTVNLERPDPDCSLRHVMNTPLETPVRHVISNSFGFGGSNGVLALGGTP